MLGKEHQYPDGAVLYLGTMFAPTEDRGAGAGLHPQGRRHRHHPRAANSARSTNRMTTADEAPAWTFGAGALMRNLAKRGVL